MNRLRLLYAELGRPISRNSLYFSLLAGNLGGEGFARDCILRQFFIFRGLGELPKTNANISLFPTHAVLGGEGEYGNHSSVNSTNLTRPVGSCFALQVRAPDGWRMEISSGKLHRRAHLPPRSFSAQAVQTPRRSLGLLLRIRRQTLAPLERRPG